MEHRKYKKLKTKRIIKNIMLSNPLVSQQEIMKISNFSQCTVNRHVNEIKQEFDKDFAVKELFDNDMLNIKLGQKLLTDKLQDPDKLKVYEIVSIMQEATRRYMLLR
jgi:hypothetical protein